MFISSKLGLPIGTPETLTRRELEGKEIGVFLKDKHDFYLYKGIIHIPEFEGYTYDQLLTYLRHHKRFTPIKTVKILGGGDGNRLDWVDASISAFTNNRFNTPTIPEELDFLPQVGDYLYRGVLNNNAVVFEEDGKVISFFAAYSKGVLPPPIITNLTKVKKARKLTHEDKGLTVL